jgi:hypothetical protein
MLRLILPARAPTQRSHIFHEEGTEERGRQGELECVSRIFGVEEEEKGGDPEVQPVASSCFPPHSIETISVTKSALKRFTTRSNSTCRLSSLLGESGKGAGEWRGARVSGGRESVDDVCLRADEMCSTFAEKLWESVRKCYVPRSLKTRFFYRMFLQASWRHTSKCTLSMQGSIQNPS